MCCRLLVSPLDAEVAHAILFLGMFNPPATDAGFWHRVAEAGTTVNAVFSGEHLRLELSPSISYYAQHADKRISGGIYFEIAAKYAERVGGTIKQISNVEGCKDGGTTEHILAMYPHMPMLWERVCPGFREVILGGEEHG